MKFKKRLMMGSLGILFATSLVASTAFSCTSSNNQNTSNDTSDQNNDNNNNNDNGNTNDNSSNNGNSISSEITDSSKIDSSLYSTNASNSSNVTQNIKDFLENGDFSQYKGSQDDLSKDVFLYFYSISRKYQNLKILNSNVSNLSVINSDKSNDLILNKSIVSFNASVEISSNTTQIIQLGSQNITLQKGITYSLVISVKNQIIIPQISTYLSEHYLIWQIGNASFKINNKMWNESNFSFNSSFFSHAFKYKFNNLISGYTYFDLKDKYENSAYNINASNLENKVTSFIDDEFENYIKYADYATNILNILKQDISIKQMLKELSPSIIDILVDSNIVSSSLKPFLLEALTGANSNNENIPLINSVSAYKQEIVEFFAGILNTDDIETIQTLVDMFKPGLKESDTEYQTIISIIESLGIKDQTAIKIITGDFLGVTSSAKSLLDIIFDNWSLIYGLVKEQMQNNAIVDGIGQLLNIILSKKDDGTDKSIYDALLTQKDKLFEVIKSLVSINPQIEQILKILVIDNENLSKENIIAIISAISDFMNDFFEVNTNYTSIENKYKNLTFTKETVENENATISNKKINFVYKYTFTLKKSVTMNLKVFKNLISETAAQNIIKLLINEYASNSSINIEDLINSAGGAKSILNAIYYFLPDQIILGQDSSKNSLTFEFAAENNDTWFEPILNKETNNYNAGFGFVYNMKITYYDPNMIDSITKNYSSKAEKADGSNLITGNYSDVWRQIISNLLWRDYYITLKMSIDSDNIMSGITTLNYNSEQVYQAYSFEDNIDNSENGEYIYNLFKNAEKENVYNGFSADANKNYEWKTTNGDLSKNESIDGRTPYLNNNNFALVRNKILNLNNAGNYSLSINVMFNFNINLSLSVPLNSGQTSNVIEFSLNYSFSLTVIDLYFPYKVLDTKTNKAVNSIHKNIVYSNFSAKI